MRTLPITEGVLSLLVWENKVHGLCLSDLVHGSLVHHSPLPQLLSTKKGESDCCSLTSHIVHLGAPIDVLSQNRGTHTSLLHAQLVPFPEHCNQG